MALSGELLTRLDQENEPLPKRLRLALSAFESNGLPVQQKEELILKWLCEYGEKNEKSEDVWSVLKACLNSSHMKKLSGANIRPAVKYSVSQILCKLLKSERLPKTAKAVILECAVCVLGNSNFQHYFKRQLEPLFDLVTVVLNVIIKEENVDSCVRILQIMQMLYKQVFQKESFAKLFIKKTLEPLTKILTSTDNLNIGYSTNRIKAETFKCVQQIIFPKSRSKEIALTFKSLFQGHGATQSTTIESVLEFLSYVAINVESDATVNLFSIIFQAFVSSYRNDTVSVYRMFITMCYFVGFKPEIKLSSGECKCLLKQKKIKKVFPECYIQKAINVNDTSLKVVRTLLNVLSNANVQLDDSEEIPFHEWLQSLISTIFSYNMKDSVSVVLLDVIRAFIQLNPLIIEPKLNEFLERVFLAKKDNEAVRMAYVTFLCDVLKMFMKLSRLQKFVAKLLALGTTLNSRNVEELPTLSDVLPSEFCTEFQTTVAVLPGWQTVGIMRSLLFHLNQDCVEVLEQQQDDCPLLFLEITSKLLCSFLRGTRVAEHFVPVQVVTKFSDSMTELQNMLGKLGQALLQREHSCPLMVAFLQLCYNWGEMRILLSHYSAKLEIATGLQLTSLQEDISATNLTYLHPYLSSELWNLVAQRIGNFGEADCKKLMVKLILQKLRAVVLYVDDSKMRQDITSAAAKHLVSHIREAWPILLTGTNVLLVTPFLNSEQFECLANHIVQEIISNSDSSSVWLNALESPTVQENRFLVVAIICATLNGIKKLFSRSKRKHHSPDHKIGAHSLAEEVLAIITSSDIMKRLSEDKLETLIPVVAEVTVTINRAYEETDVLVRNGYTLDIVSLQRYLCILKLFPLQHTSNSLRSLVLVCILALVITLEKSDTWTEGEHVSNTRSLLYKDFLLGIFDSSGPTDISDQLDIGKLAHWLTKIDLPLHRDLKCLLFQRLFEISLSHSSTLHQLKSALPMLQKRTKSQSQDVRSLETAVVLLQVLNKCPNEHEKSEDHSLCLKYQRRISKDIVKMMQHMDCAAISPVVCEGYKLLLLQYLKKGDARQLGKLTPYINTVVENSLSHLSSRSLSTDLSSIKSCVDVLSTLVQHRTHLNDALPSDFIKRVWNVFMSQDLSADHSLICSSTHIQFVFEAGTEKELHTLLKDLTAMTKAAIKSLENPELLKSRLSIWEALISSKLTDGRINARKMALEQLCHMLTVFVKQWDVTDNVALENSILPVLQVILITVQNSLIYLSPEMLDLCFESIVAVQTVKSSGILSLCSISLRLLQALMKFHTYLVLDCIPSLIQCYQQLVVTVASNSHVDLGYSPAKVQQCADCAHGLERLTNIMNKHKAHFVRVAAYIIADLLHQFETYTLYPQVKLHFSNCVHSLLSICDSHALSFLSRTLTPASQQLLKTYHTNYNKYHRFTGKV